MTDTAEAKLLALIEAASPGPWEVGISTDVEYGPWPCFRLAEIHPADEIEVQATRRLISLAPGLAAAVDLARALRAVQRARLTTDDWQRKCVKQAHGDSHMRCGECFLCLERKALARWDEALEGL